MTDTNLVVIGAGPGGYAAAFLAADKGIPVTLVSDESQLGGVCLQRGCIPSKALLHLAKLISETHEAKAWGLDFGEPQIDLDQLRNWKSDVVRKMTGGLTQLCRQRGVHFVTGRARFTDSQTIAVNGESPLKFKQAIIAVGSVPAIPADFDLSSPNILDSTRALEVESIPERLLVVGGGYIGLEIGTVYAALGSRVSVVEMTDGLLPGVDRDLVRILQVNLKKKFEAIWLHTRLKSIKDTSQGVQAVLEGESGLTEQVFDKVLISVGRKPNTRGLGLETTQVELDSQGFIKVDKQLRTKDPGIFAIGDAVGGAMLAHKASHEGKVAVQVISGESVEFDQPTIPAVVFTDPEIAWCGLTETEAKERGLEITVAKFPWGASGRATTMGRNDGQTKLIVDPNSPRILGVGLVGSGAGELVAEGVLAIQTGIKAHDLARVIHPHPTLSETVMEAAEVFEGTPTHIYKKPR